MKFYCDACHTKYAISDDKVRGKVLKVRCKNCGNVVTVREAVVPITGSLGDHRSEPRLEAPAEETHVGPSASGGAGAPPANNWFYALNGQSFGPFTLEGLRRKYSSAEIGDATYVWHEWLGAWKPVATEPTFADALTQGHKIVPSRKTLGFTGPVEAIRVVHGGVSTEREGVVPNIAAEKPAPSKPESPKPAAAASKAAAPAIPAEARRPTLPPAKPQPALPTPKSRQAPTPEARPLNDARAGNVERLRERLSSAYDPADDEAAPLPTPVGGESVLTFAEGVTPASAASSQELRQVTDAVDFSLPPRAKPAKPSPSSTSDILERAIGPTPEPPSDGSGGLAEDSGVVPFFPEGPRLAAQHAANALGPQDGTSESLLIDMGKMNKAGRKRGTVVAVVGGLVVLVVVGVGIALALRSKDAAPEPVAVVKPEHKDELVIKRYGKDEVDKIAMLDLEEELLFNEDEVDEPDAGLAAEQPQAAPAVVAKVDKTPSIQAPPRSKGAAKIRVKEEAPTATEEPPAAEEEPKKVDPLAALLAPRAGRSTEIKSPEDRLRAAPADGLSKEEARKGFSRVKKSIAACRERHNRYNAKLDAQKLKISVTVEPNGSVSGFTLEPRSVQNTEFHNCMNSHRERWRFAAFSGKSVVINTSVILQ